MEVSQESKEMWKGRAELAPLKIGVVDNLFLSSLNVVQYASFQLNSTSFVNRVNKGEASLEKDSMNIL